MSHGTDGLIGNTAENTLHCIYVVNFFPILLSSSYAYIKHRGRDILYWIPVAGYFKRDNKPSGIS